MKKIVFLINSLTDGGAERVISVIVNELSNEGYELELICLEKDNFYDVSKNVKISYLSDFTGGESGIKKFLFLPILALRLKRYINEHNIKLIQSHLFRANYVNSISRLFGSNHIVQIVTAGRISRYKELGIVGRVNLFLINILYQKADLIISKAKGMQNDMQKLFHFKNKKRVINNPYDLKKIGNLAKESVNNFHFDNNKKYIISVGRLIILKRNHELIHCLKNLGENVEIIFLGDGTERNNIIQQSIDLEIQHRVHVLGQVKNPYKYISRADIFVSCSESEGFPNVLVESMICGTPVISTDCISGPREILAPGTDINNLIDKSLEMAEYGILYPIGDVKSLCKSINILLENDCIVNNYIEKGLVRANDFSICNIMKQYKEVLCI